MGTLGTLNAMTENRSISFDSLWDVANGKYNMGEVVAKKGIFGGIVFDKINNHVSNTQKNDVVRSVEQNRATNAAVFRTILEHYGRENGDLVEQIKSMDVGTLTEQMKSADIEHPESAPDPFWGFKNRYIETAFNFLMTDGAADKPLSRDELKLLLNYLHDGALSFEDSLDPQKTKVSGRTDPKNTLVVLNHLRTFKQTEGKVTGEDVTRPGIRIWQDTWSPIVKNAKGHTLETLAQVSKNQRWHSGNLNEADQAAMKADTATLERYKDIRNLQNGGQNRFQFTDAEIEAFDKSVEAANVGTVEVKSNNQVKGAEEIGLNPVEVKDDLEVAKKKDAQMAFLGHLARYAGGASGGRGFVGIDEFGNTVKFLTKWHESCDVNALSEGDKKCLNDATDRLRKKIVDLANGLDDNLKKAVLAKLPSELPKNGLKDFIKRETVAQIVNLVAGGLTDSKGGKFNWKGIKPAATLSSTTLEKVFNFEYRHNLEKLRAGDTKTLKIENGGRLGSPEKDPEKTKVFTSQMLHCLEDADIQKKLADEDLGITEGRDVKAPSAKMTSLKKEHIVGSTSKALATLLTERYPGKRISAMGYGDDTYCACYWKTATSQEEDMFRMLDPNTAARFKAHGKVKQTTHSNGHTKDVLRYEGNVRSRVSPAMGGVHVNTSLVAADNQPLPEAMPIGIVIGAAPSLTNMAHSKDIIGNLDHMVMCRKDLLQDERTIQMWNDLDPEMERTNPAVYNAAVKMQDNAYNFCDKFWSAVKGNDDLFPFGDDAEEFRTVMQMELYLKFDDVDVYADDTDAQVKKMLEHLVALKNNPEEWNKAKEQAHENYAQCMREMYKNIIRLEHAQGTEVLVVGPMGGGYFNNATDEMLDYLAEACVLEGGDMQIVLSQYQEDKTSEDGKNANTKFFEERLEFYAKKHGVIQ